jgi:hypothetical protein
MLTEVMRYSMKEVKLTQIFRARKPEIFALNKAVISLHERR